jgi:2-dehydro-3-deoxygluconokinase
MTRFPDVTRDNDAPLVVGLGEAMIRLGVSARTPLQRARELDVAVAGSELNMLVVARALGVSARWLTRLPANDLGEIIRRHAMANGVEVMAYDEPGARAGLFFLEVGAPPRASTVLYDRADSAASHMNATEFDWDEVLSDAACAHVTGVTCALGEGPLAAAIAFLESARRVGVMTSFDMNYRSRLWQTDGALVAFRRVLPLVDTLFAAPRDIALLTQSDGATEHLAKRVVAECGTTTLVIRERHEISPYALGVTVKVFGNDESVSEARGVVVDELGAGDAAAGAFLASKILGDKVSVSAERCARAYARMLTIPGDTWSGSIRDLSDDGYQTSRKLVR